MINLILKVHHNQTIIVTNDEKIHKYNSSIEEVMNIYLKPLLLTYKSLNYASKGILGENKYKRPLAYYTANGLNVLIPTGSIRNNFCCFVSLNYALTHTLEEFNALTKLNLTNFQWAKLITSGLTYKNMFCLDLEIPCHGICLSKQEMMDIMQKSSS